MYNLKQKGPHVLYISKMKNNAFTRRKTHIQKAQANKTKNLPTSQYINHIKPQNLDILLLMSVANYNQYLHYYESPGINL